MDDPTEYGLTDGNVQWVLQKAGVSSHEREALALDKKHELPGPGKYPQGFGLWGSTGCGKTFAMVQLAGFLVRSVFCRNYDPERAENAWRYHNDHLAGEEEAKERGRASYKNDVLDRTAANFLWLNWPDAVSKIKRRPLEYAEFIEDPMNVRCLFLDDLGNETIRGEADLGLEQLKALIDSRYRHGHTMFWTSNLNPDAINARYGSMLADRLLATWPPIKIQGKSRVMQIQEGDSASA